MVVYIIYLNQWFFNPPAKVWLLLAGAVQTRRFRPRKARVGLELRFRRDVSDTMIQHDLQ